MPPDVVDEGTEKGVLLVAKRDEDSGTLGRRGAGSNEVITDVIANSTAGLCKLSKLKNGGYRENGTTEIEKGPPDLDEGRVETTDPFSSDQENNKNTIDEDKKICQDNLSGCRDRRLLEGEAQDTSGQKDAVDELEDEEESNEAEAVSDSENDNVDGDDEDISMGSYPSDCEAFSVEGDTTSSLKQQVRPTICEESQPNNTCIFNDDCWVPSEPKIEADIRQYIASEPYRETLSEQNLRELQELLNKG